MIIRPLIRRDLLKISPTLILTVLLGSGPVIAGPDRNAQRSAPISPIDRLLADTTADSSANASAGSLYAVGGSLGDLAMDFRATRVGDVVTVVVLEQATANAQGTTATKRASSAKSSVNSLAGITKTG